MAIRVLLPQPILPAGYEYLREHGYEVVDGRGFTEDDIVADIADCDAIIVRTAKITKRIFDAAPKLKILARHGAGYDGVDLAAAREQAAQITARYQAQADNEAQSLAARNEKAAAEREERLVSVAQMESRKVILAAKQEMVEKAYDLALEKLCAMRTMAS